MSMRRLLPLVLLNIVVSATVVLLILNWWEQRQDNNLTDAAATVQPATPFGVASTLVADPVTDTPPEETLEAAESDETFYIVQSGDTLGSISAQFNVPLDDLIAANNIDNPNIVAAGETLLIPVNGVPTAAPEAAPTETPAPTVQPTPGPVATEPLETGVVIIEITEVIGVGELADEAVSLANFGDRAVALQGWQLSDSQGRVYTFGQVTLFGEGAAILVHTETGQDGPSDLYWGLEEAIWESGATVTLQDAEGNVQATYNIP